MPAVSVVVPVYRVEKYLRRAVDSIRAQTLAEIEIILVDDGSPDDCGKICDAYQAQDVRIKVIHKQNEGLGFSRNRGVDAATGDYIAFIDSDDFIERDMLRTMYAAACESNADVVLSGMNIVYSNGANDPRSIIGKQTVFQGKKEMVQVLLNIVGSLPHEKEDSLYSMSVCTCLFKRETIVNHQIRFCSERKLVSEDLMFHIDFFSHAQTAVISDGIFYNYCVHPSSLSKRYWADRFQADITLYKEVCKRLDALCPKEQSHLYVDRMLQAYARFDSVREINHSYLLNDRKGLRARLLKISGDQTLQAALKSFPWYQLPRLQAVYAFCMKHKLLTMQILLTRLKDRVFKKKMETS